MYDAPDGLDPEAALRRALRRALAAIEGTLETLDVTTEDSDEVAEEPPH